MFSFFQTGWMLALADRWRCTLNNGKHLSNVYTFLADFFSLCNSSNYEGACSIKEIKSLTLKRRFFVSQGNLKMLIHMVFIRYSINFMAIQTFFSAGRKLPILVASVANYVLLLMRFFCCLSVCYCLSLS